jgi:DNA-3-methyladenine glycosylase II
MHDFEKGSFVTYHEVSSPKRKGAFTIPHTQSLHHFCTGTTQTLVHPDYFDHQGIWYRLVAIDGKHVAINVSPAGHVQWSCNEAIEDTKVWDIVNRLLISFPLPDEVRQRLPQELEARFCSLHPLVHITSLSLGEAIMKAIIRQVITAGHAKKLINSFIRRYGGRRVDDGQSYYDFPTVETIARIPLEELQAEGLGFKAKVVHGTALSILEHDLEAKVTKQSPVEALDMLTAIKGIGRWTARVAICDLFADWSYYPFEDLAVRTWARKLWPGVQWPQDDLAFAAYWQQMNEVHSGIVTFYLLSCAATQHVPQPYVQEVLF